MLLKYVHDEMGIRATRRVNRCIAVRAVADGASPVENCKSGILAPGSVTTYSTSDHGHEHWLPCDLATESQRVCS